ncbi:dehydrogenase/reductase SDR family member 7 isoform X2 [Cephus cinctus]|uniref:Dehydrogenase/reductase SDR family member 7 isoform X2 n=1 Tax=Cephus cinctus TaxID=211228 RepID=A0AAJ7RJS7_CEPCN|nr:dehydrogenase/reductase SDR family member 7 isoform X2 [Cephus cinctus]
MDLLAIFGFLVLIYHLFYMIFPWFLNCNLQLALMNKYGKSIETLRGKVVWIVGASSGIGESLVYRLASVGCKLIISSNQPVELQEVKNSCLNRFKYLKEDDIEVLAMDVVKMESHKPAFRHVIEKFGQIDILVNNVGKSQQGAWENIDLEVDREMFDLNVFSIISLSRIVLRYFISRGHGHLAVTSSLDVLTSSPFSATYTASKSALHAYFESLFMEKMNSNIPITIICPGSVQTDILSQVLIDNLDEVNNKPSSYEKNKISPACCSRLIAVALANKLHEVWISPPLLLQLTYMKFNEDPGC